MEQPTCGDRHISLCLSNQYGSAVVLLTRQEVRRFLDRSHHRVPTGQEYRLLRLDEGLAALLDPAG
ncbi:SsgA family sporulation/cell division regulator [Streptomyces sp. NPDC013178]|uniref:SsgA family sporulation/cell division regulator n=1 Tax=Streptomyces sp. NPDC013178 TaxID=3155118 RepID=UPI0033F9DD78